MTAWDAGALVALIEHILQRYHDTLREELPRLAALSARSTVEDEGRNPALCEVAAVCAALRTELEAHLLKEEHVLFPFIAQLEQGAGHRHPMLGRIGSPIGVMEREHDEATDALTRLSSLTDGFSPPADASSTVRALLDGLARLERELHAHIHLENHVLFPRARALEERVISEGH